MTSEDFPENSTINPSFEYTHRHKPGCPKYIPLPEHNLLSSNLFTHTTIDNVKKMLVKIFNCMIHLPYSIFIFFIFRILPDIPQDNELFNDQTYIHFYIPSKTENISLDKLESLMIDKDKSFD